MHGREPCVGNEVVGAKVRDEVAGGQTPAIVNGDTCRHRSNQ